MRSKIDSPQEAVEVLRQWKGVLLAVSGGLDSVVLLHAAASCLTDVRLEVAHVDHNLRSDSEQDAKFVESLASKLDLPFHTTVLGSVPQGANLENWARLNRYSFLRKVVSERGLAVIATAHHENDVIETLLMRLVSNKELYSIAPHDPKRSLVRPFLQVNRSRIQEYAENHGLEHVEDETNRDTRRLRNRVRHNLIPIIEDKFGRAAIESLASRARCVEDDLSLLNRIVDSELSCLASFEIGSKFWVRGLTGLVAGSEPGLQWRMCERAIKPVVGFNLGREHSARLVEFLLKTRTAIELPDRWTLRRKDGGIVFEKKK